MQKIQKEIHYCWFGGNKKTKLIKRCIASWHKYCPDYKITEWNEDNFDVSTNNYAKTAYNDKKWAFVSDYARIKILNENGGIYLDTDMELIKPLDALLNDEVFLGFGTDSVVNAGIIGAVPKHKLLIDTLKIYENLNEMRTIPNILTESLKIYGLKHYKMQTINGIRLYPIDFFYPFALGEKFNKSCITKNTYSIHWWDFSWGSPIGRLLNKFSMLQIAVNTKTSIRNLFLSRNIIEYNRRVHNKMLARYNFKHNNCIFSKIEQSRIKQTLEYAFASIETTDNKKILVDFGSGTGNLTRHLLDFKQSVLALDVSDKLLQFIKKELNNENLFTKHINGIDLASIKSESVDMVCTYSVLHHIPNYLKIIDEMCRIVKSGGILYIDHENNANFWIGDNRYSEFLKLNKISRTLSEKLLLYGNPLNYLEYVKVKLYNIIRYQPEGDIHVYHDDHINFQDIDKILKQNNVKTIVDKDYLSYKSKYKENLYKEYSNKTSDMKLLICKKM